MNISVLNHKNYARFENWQLKHCASWKSIKKTLSRVKILSEYFLFIICQFHFCSVYVQSVNFIFNIRVASTSLFQNSLTFPENLGVDQDSMFAPSNFSLKCCVGTANWDARKTFLKDIFRFNMHIPLSIIRV